MNRFLFILFLILEVALFTGCQTPAAPDSQTANAEFIKDVKLSDLQESIEAKQNDQVSIAFRVFTFSVEPELAEQVKDIVGNLSQKNIRYADKEAFEANGIAVGSGPYQKSEEVVQALQQFQAQMAVQTNMSIMPDVTELMSSVPLTGRRSIVYSTSATGLANADLEQGNLGWLITAHPDPAQPGYAQVKLEPAFWQTGLQDLRLKVDKEPYDFYKFNVARIVVRMTLGDVVVIAPSRKVPIHETLDKYLFYVPGRRPKVQLFVILCQNPGTQ